MKASLKQQLIEFLCEIALFTLYFICMGQFFSPVPQIATRSVFFALNLWAVWVMYRFIFLQIPFVMYVKHYLFKRNWRATWVRSLVNVVSILLSFILFGIFFGDAQSFFSGEHIAIPAIFLFTGIVAPYSIRLWGGEES